MGFTLSAPRRTLVPVGNIRTQGEAVSRGVYQHNRTARVRVTLGPLASYASLTSALRTLLHWLDAPPGIPFTLQYQAPNASAPSYLDVVGCAHTLPLEEEQWLRLQLEPVEITFLVRPGLKGDRVTLQNLAPNPGFEQGVGSGGTGLQRQLRQRQLLRGAGGVGADGGFLGDDAGRGRAGGVRLAGVVTSQPVAIALQVGDGADGAILPALHGREQPSARRGDGDELGADPHGRGDADDDGDGRGDADQWQFLLDQGHAVSVAESERDGGAAVPDGEPVQ